MKQFRRRKNLLRVLVLGFATAAIVASTAQAKPMPSNYNTSAQEARTALNQTYTPAAMKALELRSEGMNKLYQASQVSAVRPDDRVGVRGVEPTVATGVVGSDYREILRHIRADEVASGSSTVSTRPDDKAGIHGPGIVQTPEVVTVNGDGFDWKDAGIGAGTALGVALVLMSAFVISKRRQSGLAV
jgi:hypothetical protein